MSVLYIRANTALFRPIWFPYGSGLPLLEISEARYSESPSVEILAEIVPFIASEKAAIYIADMM